MIGIFGGTFDPIHYGHLRSALEVKELFQLDEVRLVPSSVPPHRIQPKASPEQRLRMLELAVNKRPELIIDTRELSRGGNSYMIDTLSSLRSDYPDRTLFLFIGCDAFNGLNKWHRWRHLFDYCHIVVMTRPGFEVTVHDDLFYSRLAKEKSQLQDTLAGKLYFQAVTQLDISATMIRNLIADNRNPGFLLPDAVLEYIKNNKLYEH